MYEDIMDAMHSVYTVAYSPNYLISIINTEVPKKIALKAKKLRLEIETPFNKRKNCTRCGKFLPMDPIFFSRNNAHKDSLSNTCKEGDKKSRI